MKKILSVILGLALCCMLAALPVCAEETAAPVQAETAEIGDGHVTLVSDSDQLIPVYVDEEAEGAEGTVEQAMADFSVGGTIAGLINDSGIYDIIKGNWKSAVMILISFVLLYLAIVKQFEPLLLMPIAPASAGVKPRNSATMNARKIPSCAAAPSSRLIGLAISGPKSVIAPTPMKMSGGKMPSLTP